MIKDEEKWISFKKDLIESELKFYNKIPIFSLIEFNLLARCTRRCVFCPASEEFYENLYGSNRYEFKVKLYKKILFDLKLINYEGIVAFSGFSEPFLHKNIIRFVSLSRKYLPNSIIIINTNGDMLNHKVVKAVFDAGLSRLDIQLYDSSDQIDYFKSMIDDANVDFDKIFLRRRYFKHGNYGMYLTNRSGLIDTSKFRNNSVELPIKQLCFYPFYMMKIDFTGDVIICSHDWSKKSIIGNVKDQNVLELWKSEKLNKIRKLLTESNRNFLPCSLCDVKGDKMGKEHYNAWIKSEFLDVNNS